MPLTKLTPEEDTLQQERGLHFRSLLSEATTSLLEGVTNPAIFLSGGVDSTTTLWAMLESGARPGVFSFHTKSGTKQSSDARKAQQLAKHYGLPFTLVTLPQDPDEVARRIERIVRKYPALYTRPDFEVCFTLEVMYEAAAAAGHDAVFSGISDCTLHLLSRQLEIAGRGDKISLEEADTRRLMLLDDSQFPPIVALAREHNLALAAPIHLVAHLLPYNGVPWRVMNTPRNKAITIRAYAKEIETTKLSVKPQPMQGGDTNIRAYFDEMIAASPYAEHLAGRKCSTAQVYYNSLHQLVYSRSPRKKRKVDTWSTWRRAVLGETPPPKWQPEWPLTEDGRSAQPPGAPSVNEDELFAEVVSAVTPDVLLDEEGNPDTRVDCWGVPFWEGESAGMTGCARARAGLCGVHHPESPWALTTCEAFTAWYGEATAELRAVAEQHAGTPLMKGYSQWALRCEENCQKILAEAAR